MTTHSDKIKKTIIEKYGDWETYLALRYRNPKAKEDQKRAASLGGKASTNRPFKDVEKAKEAYRKGIGAKHNGSGK